jgi:hypothetical protein
LLRNQNNLEEKLMSDVISGPLWAAANWSIDEGTGSIHDNETAQDLGFRGGTVAGDIHMNQFPPVLLKIFGNEWFERGNLSLNYKFATVDKEKVQVFAEPLTPGANQIRVWMEREDGTLVCTGTAAMGDHSKSELRDRDLRACDPSELRILRNVKSDLHLGSYDMVVSADKQTQRFEAGLISDPLDWYDKDSPWGAPVACPSTYVQYMWGPPMDGLRPLVEDAVGLFSAIEIGNISGPLLLNKKYHFESNVIAVGQSPQTEIIWHETTADNDAGERVANFRMMQRFMKGSSLLYQESA